MNRYLLSCPCSCRIEVAATQAGGTVRCPGCGGTCVVPRLGELSRLDVAASGAPSPARRGWGPIQACVLVGVVVAAAAAVTAGWLRGRQTAVAPLDERAIAASVTTAPADRVYEAWRAYERQGIARPPLPDEERRTRHAESLAALEKIAWVAAAAGAGLAAAAAAVGRGGLRK